MEAKILDQEDTLAPEDEDALPDSDDPFFPCRTRGILGHKQAETLFLEALKSKRLPHAWIFYGAKGIGKASFAYHVARHFLSGNNLTTITNITTPPDSKTNLLIETGAHPDLFVLKRTYSTKNKRFNSDILADEARGLRKSLQHTAAMGGWRIAIIDSIDEMNKGGVNSLLKLIEEPPPRVLFIIICHQIGSIIDTIRSRSRMLHFDLLSPDIVSQIMEARFSKLTEEDRSTISFLSDGSAVRACRFAMGEGLMLYTRLATTLLNFPNSDIKALYELAGQAGNRSKPENFSIFCDLFSGWLHRFIRASVTGHAPENLPESEANFLEHWHGKTDIANMLAFWQSLQKEINSTTRLNLDKKQAVLEWLNKTRALLARE